MYFVWFGISRACEEYGGIAALGLRVYGVRF